MDGYDYWTEEGDFEADMLAGDIGADEYSVDLDDEEGDDVPEVGMEVPDFGGDEEQDDGLPEGCHLTITYYGGDEED